MAVTATFTLNTNGKQRVGKQHVHDGVLALSGTYDTGGFAVSASTFGLQALETLQTYFAFNGANMLTARFDPSAGKVLLYWGDNNNANDGPLIEIPNSTSVASYTLDVTAKGR